MNSNFQSRNKLEEVNRSEFSSKVVNFSTKHLEDTQKVQKPSKILEGRCNIVNKNLKTIKQSKNVQPKEHKELNQQRVLKILTEPVKFKFPKQSELGHKTLININAVSTKNIRKALNKTSSSGSRDRVEVSHSEIVSKKRTAVINLAVLGGKADSSAQNTNDR